MLRGAATGNLQFQHFVVHSGPSIAYVTAYAMSSDRSYRRLPQAPACGLSRKVFPSPDRCNGNCRCVPVLLSSHPLGGITENRF
jgi:hypothetical protein